MLQRQTAQWSLLVLPQSICIYINDTSVSPLLITRYMYVWRYSDTNGKQPYGKIALTYLDTCVYKPVINFVDEYLSWEFKIFLLWLEAACHHRVDDSTLRQLFRIHRLPHRTWCTFLSIASRFDIQGAGRKKRPPVTLEFCQFYCFIHTSAYVKSLYLAIKNK